MKYILRTFCCNSKLQTAVFIYGVLASVLSGILLITTLSTNIFKVRIGHTFDNYHYNYFDTSSLYWSMLFASAFHMISSIFLAIGVEKKNVYMIAPWLVVQGVTLAPVIPITVGAFLCFAVVAFPVYLWWTVFSLFVTLRELEARGRPISAAPVTATAPSSTVLYANNFNDIPLPAYNDVIPGRVANKY